MNALIYLRRSSESDDKTVSLRVQEEACRKYAAEHGLTVVLRMIDDGVSGTDRDRFNHIRFELTDAGLTQFIVYSVDRLARDIAGLMDEMKYYAKNGITVHCVTRGGPIDTTKSHEFLSVGVEALVAEHWSRQCSEKIKAAHARLKAEGKRQSRFLPVGYFVDKQTGLLKEDQRVMALIEHAKGFKERGLTLRAIDVYMRGKGLKLALSTWSKVLR